MSSPNPLSERQHPLFLPTVLDTVFPYLNFSELKSSRLVCKTWSEIAIPFITRRKLKPINFSSINYEEFLSLKKEFIKFPNKVKLFQGFQIQWDEIPGMVWSKFLTSFKPRQLVLSGRNISDPSSNFGNLLQPVLTTLTDLSLELTWDSREFCSLFIALLNNIGQLQPMTLKRLRIIYSTGFDVPTCISHKMIHAFNRAFEGIFQSQSPFLEELELKFKYLLIPFWEDGRGFEYDVIQLPVFPRLQRLSLSLELEKLEPEANLLDVFSPIFAPFNFCDIFPRLIQMELLDSLLFTMRNDTINLTKGHPLEKLIILNIGGPIPYIHRLFKDYDLTYSLFRELYSSFPYVQEFNSKGSPILSLEEDGIEFKIPWVDTLRSLEGDGLFKDFNFKYLKKLEILQFTLNKNKDIEENEFHILSIIGNLLEHYHQLPHLKRFYLNISNLCNISPEIINEVQEGLPAELRAILTIDDK